MHTEERKESNEPKQEQIKQVNEIKEVRKQINGLVKEIEKQVLAEKCIIQTKALTYIKEINELLTKAGRIRSVSESSAVERYALNCTAIKGIALVRACLTEAEEVEKELMRIKDERVAEIFSRNINVCCGVAEVHKDVLIESLFAGILRKDNSIMNRVSLFRAMKQKMHIKQRITGKEDYLMQYIERKAIYVIRESVERNIPVTKDTTREEFYEILQGIVETGDQSLLSQLVLAEPLSIPSSPSNYTSLNAKTALQQLSSYEASTENGSEIDSKEREENIKIYGVILEAVAKYIMLKKQEKHALTGRGILECIFSEEEIDLMLSLLEKGLSPQIDGKILSILVEGEVPLSRRNVSLTPYTFRVLSRYISMQGPDAEPILFEIVNGLETDFTADTEDEKERSFEEILVLDFFNDALIWCINNNHSENSIVLQKYIGGPVLDLYNGLICCMNSPLITFGYLKMVFMLVHTDKERSTYFSSPMQRDMVLSKCVSGITSAVKQLSMYCMEEEYLYIERCPEETLSADKVRDGESIRNAISYLLQIILLLPVQMKITATSAHLVNILFRTISQDRCIADDILFFVSELFKCSGVVQKLSSSMESKFFSLLSALVQGGRIEVTEQVLQKNQRLYEKFLLQKVVTPETVQRQKENPALYSLLATVSVCYYINRDKRTGIEVKDRIKQIYSEVIRILSGQTHIVASLAETREISAFFKAISFISSDLSIDTEDFLCLLLKTEPCSAEIDIKRPYLSVLYKCTNKSIAECFFFYHFVSKGATKIIPSTDAESGRFILGELSNAFSSSILKYIALFGLSEKNVPPGSKCAELFSAVDLSEMDERKRILFSNQIYRALFLTGVIQEARGLASISTNTNSNAKDAAGAVTYSYADMCVRSAIKITQRTKTPHPVDISVVSAASPNLVSALLYLLYKTSPYSPMNLAYIEKMKHFAKEDTSYFAKLLFSVVSR